MKMNLCAVYDRKTGLFDKPFAVRHNGDAIRDWDIVTKNRETRYGAHPSDFDLMCIGSFDDETGLLEKFQPHIHLANGVSEHAPQI